jgi:hypothetical protein
MRFKPSGIMKLLATQLLGMKALGDQNPLYDFARLWIM